MILFVNTVEAPNHAGVYLGDGRFVHSYQKIGITIDSLVTNKIWKERVYGFFRLNQ
jgi:cell wall-associated NlpC family hydrolase